MLLKNIKNRLITIKGVEIFPQKNRNDVPNPIEWTQKEVDITVEELSSLGMLNKVEIVSVNKSFKKRGED